MPRKRQSFVMRPSSRWGLAYVFAAYAVAVYLGIIISIGRAGTPGHLFDHPAEMLGMGLAFPVFLPFFLLYGLGAFEFGIQAALPSIGMYLVFALTFTACMFILGRWRSKPKPGYCHVCGYDLRATPNRCPECGTVPEKVN